MTKLIKPVMIDNINSNAAIDSGKPVNAEPTTCSISIIVVCGTNV